MQNEKVLPAEIDKLDVNAEEYGLDISKAAKISESFLPAVTEFPKFLEEYNSIVNADINGIVCKDAKKLRLSIAKTRTSVGKIHRAEKDFYLQAGRFVDACKNKLQTPLKEMEGKLKDIETHFEKLEEEKNENVRQERNAIVDALDPEAREGIDLAFMPEKAFVSFVGGLKYAKEQKEKAETELEAQRKENERIEAEKRQAIIDENNRLAEEKAKLEEEQAKKEAEAKRIQDEKDAEIAAANKKIAEEKAENERIIKEQKKREADRLKKERLQKEAEAKAKEDAIQAELNKGDAAKKKDLIESLEELKTKFEFKSKKNKAIYIGVQVLLDKVVAYIKKG